MIIISRPPNKPPPPPPEPLPLDAVFLVDSVSEASESSLSESSPSLITTGSCLGGATNDTYTCQDMQELSMEKGNSEPGNTDGFLAFFFMPPFADGHFNGVKQKRKFMSVFKQLEISRIVQTIC